MPTPSRKTFWDDPRLVFPEADVWLALGDDARAAVIERILDALSEYRELMAEGVRHMRSKVGAAAELDGHFRRAGQRVFVASELPVFYPGEAVIAPDVMAVLDCDPDIEPDSWVVVDQGRGLDIVLEVRNQGKAHKDLVDAVRDYARRRIPEYFAFDCRRGHLRGWRLGSADATGYQPIVPQGGYLPSRVLGLNLAVVGTRLRFYTNGAIVPDANELIARLEAATDAQQAALDDSARKLDDALDRLGTAQTALTQGLLSLCAARGVVLSPDQQAQIVAEDDVVQLSEWLRRATVVETAERLLAR